MPLHQIKARSRARIFRDHRRNESRCPFDIGRRSGASLSPERLLVPRIDPGRFTAGIDLIDDQEDRALSPCAASPRRASPRLASRCRAVFLWPWGRDGGINPLRRLLTLGTRRSWLMPAVLFRVNVRTEFIAFEANLGCTGYWEPIWKVNNRQNLLDSFHLQLSFWKIHYQFWKRKLYIKFNLLYSVL